MTESDNRFYSVSIRNFRCHLTLDVELDEGLTHLKGMNGEGKSTFFEAIKWCLYGGRGGNAPWPSLLDGRKRARATTVEITTESYRIFRRNSPGEVIYEDDSGDYHDEDAQYRINLLYGSHPLWYVSQRNDSILMTAPDNVRHEAIMNLIFPGDYANELISNAKARHKMNGEELEEVTNQLDKLERIITNTKKRYGIVDEDFTRIKELDSLKSESVKLREELDSIIEHNGKILQFQQQKKSVIERLNKLTNSDAIVDGESEIERLQSEVDNTSAIKSQLEECEKKLNDAKVTLLSKTNQLMEQKMNEVFNLQNQLSDLNSRLMKCKEYNSTRNHRDSLHAYKSNMESELSSINEKITIIDAKLKVLNPQYSHLTNEEFNELINQNVVNERTRTINYSNAKKLNLPYNESAINGEVEKLKSMIIPREINSIRQEHARLTNSMSNKLKTARELPNVRQKRDDLVKTLDETTNKIERIKKSIRSINLEELNASKEDLSTRLHHAALAESYQKLKCPHCKNECGLHNGKLVAEVPESKEKSSELSTLMNALNDRIKKDQYNLNVYNKNLNTSMANEARLRSEIRSIEARIEEMEESSNMEVDSELITSLSRKIKDHDYASERIRDVKRIEVVEVLNLSEDKEERRLKDDKHKLQRQIQSIDIKSINDTIKKVNDKLNSLKSIDTCEYLENKINAINDKLRECELNYMNNIQSLNSSHEREVNNYKSHIKKLNDDLNEERKKCQRRQDRIHELRDKMNAYQVLTAQLKDLEESPLNDEESVDLAKIKDKLTQLDRSIDRIERASELVLKRKRVLRLKKKVKELNQLLIDGGEVLDHLQKFKYVRIESYFRQLTDYCNRFIEVLMKNENVVMSLGITKTLKNKKTKNAVHINIIKDDHEVDYTALNVGHRQILSLILTLSITLTRLDNVQIILLDEVLNSLSVEWRERCLNLFDDANLNPLYELMEPIIKSKRVVLIDHAIKYHPQSIKLY
jgi:exonuclease SbcC